MRPALFSIAAASAFTGIGILATTPPERRYLGLILFGVGLALFLGTLFASRQQGRRADADRLEAFTFPSGKRVTYSGFRSRPEMEQRALLQDPAFRRWYKQQMHRSAIKALDYYFSFPGKVALRLKRLLR